MRGRGAARVRVRTTEPGQASEVLGKLGLADIQASDGEISAQIGDQAPEAVCRELVLAGVPVAGFDTPRPSLEDLFVELTGEGFDVDG
jgi:ABC-2 type transport system ATP-binding protein